MRLLVVDDNPRMAELISRVMTADDWIVEVARDGSTAIAAATSPFDAIVLDRRLPDLDGLDVVRLLRKRGVWAPVLMLTTRGRVDQRVDGLEAGADDCLAKPFAAAELIARVRALTRRRLSPAQLETRVGDLVLDEVGHVVRVADRTERLSAREFALLSFFMRHADQVLSRRQILDAVWGAEWDAYSNVIDLYVHYLRSKLAQVGRSDLLHTVRGVGYEMRSPG